MGLPGYTPRRGGGGGGAAPAVLAYTDLATLLAASGSAGDRALLQTAGGDNIGLAEYDSTLGWIPGGWWNFTAVGTNTALGAPKIVNVAGSAPSWSSGCVVTSGDAARLDLWTAFTAYQITGLALMVEGVVSMPVTPAAGGNEACLVGFATDAPKAYGALHRFYEAAAVYTSAVGYYYGAPAAYPTVSNQVLGAVTPGDVLTSFNWRRSATNGEVSGGGQNAAGALADTRDASVTEVNLGMGVGDSVLGLHIAMLNDGTSVGASTFTVKRVHFAIQGN